MTSLKQLKALAEAHQHIRYYTESPELKEDVEYFTAFSPKTVLKLISALEKYEEALREINGGPLKTLANQLREIDPYPPNQNEVKRLFDFVAEQALTQVQKIMEGK